MREEGKLTIENVGDYQVHEGDEYGQEHGEGLVGEVGDEPLLAVLVGVEENDLHSLVPVLLVHVQAEAVEDALLILWVFEQVDVGLLLVVGFEAAIILDVVEAGLLLIGYKHEDHGSEQESGYTDDSDSGILL